MTTTPWHSTRGIAPCGRGRRYLRGASVASAVLLLLVVRCAAQEPNPGEDPSKQAFQRVCSTCHPAEAVTVGRKTQSQWEETFFKMIEEQGAKGSDEDFELAFTYLVRNYGRVNINRSARLEVTAVLGLSADDANKILDYRRDHGDFKDFDSLLQVPGIDVEKLKHGKDAISF